MNAVNSSPTGSRGIEVSTPCTKAIWTVKQGVYYINYLNFRRPCFFPETRLDGQGKQRKVYRYETMMTPYDKLKSLSDAKAYLKPDLSFAILDRLAHQINDNQAADRLQKARQTLFKTIYGRIPKTG